jgi:hypothetical protein
MLYYLSPYGKFNRATRLSPYQWGLSLDLGLGRDRDLESCYEAISLFLKGIKFASRTGEKNTTLCNGRKSYQSRI